MKPILIINNEPNEITITVPKDTAIDMLGVQRLADGSELGCLPCAIFQKSGQYLLRYRKESEVTVESLLGEKLTKDLLLRILTEIVSTMEKAAAQGLSAENFILDKRQIYIDSFSNKLLFIYLPVKDNLFEKVSIKDFVGELILSAPYDKEDDPEFLVSLQNFATAPDEVSYTDLKEILTAQSIAAEELGVYRVRGSFENKSAANGPETEQNFYSPGQAEVAAGLPADKKSAAEKLEEKSEEKFAEKKSAEIKAAAQESAGQASANLASADQVSITQESAEKAATEEKPAAKPFTYEQPKSEPMFTGSPSGASIIKSDNGNAAGTTLLQKEDGTTVLQRGQDGTTILGGEKVTPIKPFLVAKTTGEEIIINKPEFKLGRDRRRCDYAIKNRVVGRLHAKILTIDGEYFLEDITSRNGTFVNGFRVKPGTRVKIKHDDKLTLANEWFTFRLY